MSRARCTSYAASSGSATPARSPSPTTPARPPWSRSTWPGEPYLVAAAGQVIGGGKLAARPEQLAWRRGPQGKPELARPPPSLQVSLSHSGELAALAVSDGRRVGVDIQRLTAGADVTRMSERFYPPAEARFVRAATDPADQVSRFIRLWTRKEDRAKVAGGRLLHGAKLPVR